MLHNSLNPVPLDQLVTCRKISYLDQCRTINSLVYTVTPFADNVPFFGKEIKQIIESSNQERTTQIKIGVFLYQSETNNLFFLQGDCETNCKKDQISLSIKRTGRFNKGFFLESYLTDQMPPWSDNEQYLIDLPSNQFVSREFRDGDLYFSKKGIFHNEHFLTGLWIEHAPGHSLKEAAFLRAYKGKVSARLEKGVWQEHFHDGLGVCFLQDTDGIKMYEGFEDSKPINKWFYKIQLQNGKVHSLHLYGIRVPWNITRQTETSYDFSYDNPPVNAEYESSFGTGLLEIGKIVAIQKFIEIEADLLQFELVRPYSEPESCTDLSKANSLPPLKQLILMFRISENVNGHLIQGDIDEKGRLQGDVIMDDIKREGAVIRVEGKFVDDSIVQGKITERCKNHINILDGRFNGSHFLGQFTVHNLLGKEKTVFEGKFRRRIGALTFDIDISCSKRIAGASIKKYAISTSEETSDRLIYEYQGEMASSLPDGKGNLTCWNKANTMSCNVRGDFITGIWQVGGQMTVKWLQSENMSGDYDIGVNKDRVLVSIASIDPSSEKRTPRWTLTRRSNGTMYYSGLDRQGLIQEGPEVDSFKIIETELLRLTTLNSFVPKVTKELSVLRVSSELSALADEELRAKQDKEIKRQEVVDRKAKQEALERQALENARKAREVQKQKDLDARKEELLRLKEQEKVAKRAEKAKHRQILEDIREAQKELDAEERRERMAERIRLEQQDKERIEKQSWRAKNMIDCVTQTCTSYPAVTTRDEYFEGTVYLEDGTVVTRAHPTPIVQALEYFYTKAVLEGLSRGPGEWFYTYKRTDSEGNIHRVRKRVESTGEGLAKTFLMILHDVSETDDIDEYVQVVVTSNKPLIKGEIFTGVVKIAVINKKTELITQSFNYQGDFLCTESFYKKIGDELNFEFRKGLCIRIDVAKNSVVEESVTVDTNDPTLISTKLHHRYSIRKWEKKSKLHVQLDSCEASRNRYGFYEGRRTADASTTSCSDSLSVGLHTHGK